MLDAKETKNALHNYCGPAVNNIHNHSYAFPMNLKVRSVTRFLQSSTTAD